MRNARMVIAILLVVVAVILIITTGESYAVRYVTGLVSVDVAVRLARSTGALSKAGQDRPSKGP